MTAEVENDALEEVRARQVLNLLLISCSGSKQLFGSPSAKSWTKKC